MPEERDILLRGLEAFAELGYDRASARELARRLGVSHTFINDRYGSKAAFWRAVVDAALGAQLGRLAPIDPGVDDEELIRRFITDFYRTSIDEPNMARLIADESSRDTDRLDYLYQRYFEPTLAIIAPRFESLAASGRMARIPVDILFFAIIGPISGLVSDPLTRRLARGPWQSTKEERLDRAETLACLVVDGLMAHRGTDRRRP
ncbi:TetR/AcrR family transcriptional regulator [Streptomyces phyllanthi]|uniref:TetR/AcrR family transcriptional regulator n=1 Tax=Streptomyces phyllanthi TaxID=1803180 RepID=A0A5N8W4P9_9ACTN|nr:TetR/AcrR family transcriptional regulator [Streptomyces phyllanthi]